MQRVDPVYTNTLEEFFRTYEYEPLRNLVWGTKSEVLEQFFTEFVGINYRSRGYEEYLQLWKIHPILKFIFELVKTIWKLSANPYDEWVTAQIKETKSSPRSIYIERAIRNEDGKCNFCRRDGDLTYGYRGFPSFDEKCAQKMRDIEQLLIHASVLVGNSSRKVSDIRFESKVFLMGIKDVARRAGIETE